MKQAAVTRLGVVLGLAALAACRDEPIPDLQRFPAGTSLQPHLITIAGSQIRYLDVGSGPPVILIHGIASSMYSWRFTIGPLVQAGYRVVAFDNRGFGFSDKPDTGYSNAAYAEILRGLLDSLAISEAVLVGHSMGGAIAGEFALQAPTRVRGLVLVDAAGLGARWPLVLRVARWPIIGRILTAFRGRRVAARILRSVYADPRKVTEQDIDQYFAPVSDPDFPRALRGVLRWFRFDALQGRLEGVQVPTLVVWGAQDSWIPPQVGRTMVRELPLGAFVIVPGAGHSPAEESPESFNHTLLAFLKTGLPAPPPNLAYRVAPPAMLH